MYSPQVVQVLQHVIAAQLRDELNRVCSKAFQEGYRGYVDLDVRHDEASTERVLHVSEIVYRPYGAPLPANTIRATV